MKHSFFAMLSRMKYINRWALMRNTRTENICEHSHDVAVLSHALAVLENTRFGGHVDERVCVMLSLYHDAPETLTGDLPTPVKYDNPTIRDAYRQVEAVSVTKLLSLLPADLQEEYRQWLSPSDEKWQTERTLVKAADKLAALIKCIEEIKQGNREFVKAKRSTQAALRNMKLPAVDCFMEEFLPAYELTLDEL